MPLTKTDRINFSEKIASSVEEIALAEQDKQDVALTQQKDISLDNGHRTLFLNKNILVTGYQTELTMLDGNSRTVISEQDMVDSANFVLNNFFYPRSASNPPPSLAPSVWTKTKPYARNKAVGKLFNETFGPAVTKESDLIGAINSTLSTINSYSQIEKTTGQSCDGNNGVCSNPSYTTQIQCVLNGETWTPLPDVIANDPTLQGLMTTLISQVNSWRSFLVTQQSNVLTIDSDPTRSAQNVTAVGQIVATISNIDTWLAFPNFDTAHGQTTCVGFNSYNPLLLDPTKLQATQLFVLTTNISIRSAFLPTRQGQLLTNLGSVTQSLVDGTYTGTGLYFQRMQFISLRLDMLGGSLINVKGLEKSITAIDEKIANIQNSTAIYNTLLVCTNLVAPSNNTKIIHVKNSQGFSVGDQVFIKSTNQEEIVVQIESINSNSITLSKKIPAKYRETELARMYKDIS
jgi:hypothetical protein